MSIVVAILALGFLIFFHEFGHFIAAKTFGVGVIEFSIGMGPRLISKVFRNTRYSLKLFPFGGSCAMLGEDSAGSGDFLTAEATEYKDKEYNENSGASVDSEAVYDSDSWIDFNGVRYRESEINSKNFQLKPAWQRFIICIAGVFNNFLLAFIFSLIIIGFCGYDRPYIIGAAEGAPSESAGFNEGDLLTSISVDGRSWHSIACFRELKLWLYIHSEEFDDNTELFVRYKREGKSFETSFHPFYDTSAGTGTYRLGLTFLSGYYKEGNFLDLVGDSLGFVRYNIRLVIDSLHLILKGRVHRNEVMGPVGAVTVISDTVEESSSYGIANAFFVLLELSTMLSANLGVMNLLPVPALDGGRLLFILLEMILRRRLPGKVEERINIVGMIILLVLMVLILSNDLFNLFTGAYEELLHPNG